MLDRGDVVVVVIRRLTQQQYEGKENCGLGPQQEQQRVYYSLPKYSRKTTEKEHDTIKDALQFQAHHTHTFSRANDHLTLP